MGTDTPEGAIGQGVAGQGNQMHPQLIQMKVSKELHEISESLLHLMNYESPKNYQLSLIFSQDGFIVIASLCKHLAPGHMGSAEDHR